MSFTKTKYGYFDHKKDSASYVITDINLPVPWEFIYQNEKILLKVDQFGPAYAQAYPPNDIMLFNRDRMQKYSSWLVWINNTTDDEIFSNFYRPNLRCGDDKKVPNAYMVNFQTEKANYSFEMNGLSIETEIMIPGDEPTVVMKLKVTNTCSSAKTVELTPAMNPYVNFAQLKPWDKPEWYLKTGFSNQPQPVFFTQLLNMDSDKSKRRNVSLWSSEDGFSSAEISNEKFCGQGTFLDPDYLHCKELRMMQGFGQQYGEYNENNTIYGFPPVFALRYHHNIQPGKTKEITQALHFEKSMDESGLPVKYDALLTNKYMDETVYQEALQERKAFYSHHTSNRTINSGASFFDYYINKWVPVQLDWAASLDRGWPSGMRGTRDSANDFTSLIPLDSEKAKKIIQLILSCQREDGWFPRQYSAMGKHGQHDLRGHVDAGCWVIELIHEYLAWTKDFDFLKAALPWLNTDKKDTVFDHMVKAVDYYLENLGEHGLCKIGEGDWLDSVNKAGLLGRGESVTLSNQLVIALTQFNKIIIKLLSINNTMDSEKLKALRSKFKAAKKSQVENLKRAAFNKAGYFNSVFNDNGEWLFSDNDPDGKKRVYGPANWYAISSGVADKDMQACILKQLDFLKSNMGYRLYWPPMGDVAIDKVGRSGSGDMPFGLWENGNVYNQGSHGFLARALAVAGEGDLLFDVLEYLLPYNQEKHPTEEVLSAPYAIVNCWQQVPGFMHRGGLNFLTGSTAMALRAVYDWLIGIKPDMNGIMLDPCLPKHFKRIQVKFVYRDHNIRLIIDNTAGKSTNPKEVRLNSKLVEKWETDAFNGRKAAVITDDALCEGNNEITIIM